MEKKFTTQPLSHREQQLYFTLESEGQSVFRIGDLKELGLPFSYEHLRVLVQRLEREIEMLPDMLRCNPPKRGEI